MLGSLRDNGLGFAWSSKLERALIALLEGFDYAIDVGSSPWDFAIPIPSLLETGLTETDLRWLIRKQLVEHAREVTVAGDDGRAFRRSGDLTFTKRSCFVLTPVGEGIARRVIGDKSLSKERDANFCDEFPQHVVNSVPLWDSATRELRFQGRMVKRFKWHAANQEAVLSAFEEEGWPSRIDDPLSPRGQQDSKRRLNDTIKCLNRNQLYNGIRFRSDGSSEGVIWERLDNQNSR